MELSALTDHVIPCRPERLVSLQIIICLTFLLTVIQQSHSLGWRPILEGRVSAGRSSRVRMLRTMFYVARMRSSAQRSTTIKLQVPLSLSTFSHFDHVRSCGTLLHRGSAGSQAWGPAPEGSRWIPRRTFTYVLHARCFMSTEKTPI